MAFKIITGKTLPIGVDPGSSKAKLVQFRQVQSDLELVAAGSAEIPELDGKDPSRRLEFLGEAIGRVVKSGNFRGRQSILSLPAEATERPSGDQATAVTKSPCP